MSSKKQLTLALTSMPYEKNKVLFTVSKAHSKGSDRNKQRQMHAIYFNLELFIEEKKKNNFYYVSNSPSNFEKSKKA